MSSFGDENDPLYQQHYENSRIVARIAHTGILLLNAAAAAAAAGGGGGGVAHGTFHRSKQGYNC